MIANKLARHYNPEAHNTLVATYAATRKWAIENRETVAAFKRAINAATKFILTDDPETRKIVRDHTRIPDADVQAMGLPLFETEITKDSLQRLGQTMVDFGFIARVPAYEEIVAG